jgi:hypothetical protein
MVLTFNRFFMALISSDFAGPGHSLSIDAYCTVINTLLSPLFLHAYQKSIFEMLGFYPQLQAHQHKVDQDRCRRPLNNHA